MINPNQSPMWKSGERTLAMLVVLLGLMAGCQPDSHDSRDASKHDLLRLSSTAELRELLAVGSTTNTIAEALGQAHSIEIPGKGTATWSYHVTPFPADDKMAGTHVTELIIWFTNGILATHGFSYASRGSSVNIELDEKMPASHSTESEKPRIRIFLLSPQPVPGGRSVDSARFPDAGFMASKPDLEFSKVANVFLSQETNPFPSWTVDILLEKADASRLKTFTTANVDKRVLILIGQEAVAAAKIVAPLETGFAFSSRDQKQLDAIKDDLRILKQN